MIELTRRRDRWMIFACALLMVAIEAEARAQDEGRFEDVDAIVAEDAALAPDPIAERSAMARALFGEGLAHARDARFVEAADLFERAHALRPAPAIAYNLASALARVGRLIEASEHLQWVIRHPETRVGLRVAAERTIARIMPRLANVRLVVSGSAEGVDILLDGAPLAYAAVGVEVPLDPGPHRFDAMRGETRVAHREVELAEGAREPIELHVPAPPEPAPPEPAAPDLALALAPAPEPAPSEDLAWLGWSGAALGLAIVAAVITTALVLNEQGAMAEPIPGTTMPAFLEWR